MKPLRGLDRDMRRARLLAARRRPVGSVNRRGILSGQWDGGNVVGEYTDGRGSFVVTGERPEVDQ